MSLRYSIYKVQTASRSRGQLLHISTLNIICQELFSSFFKFLFEFAFFARPCGQLLDISTTSFICQELFSSFFKFLEVCIFFCCPRGQLRYISTSRVVCQALFHKKLHLFLVSLILRFQGNIPQLLLLQTAAQQAPSIGKRAQITYPQAFHGTHVGKQQGQTSQYAPDPP